MGWNFGTESVVYTEASIFDQNIYIQYVLVMYCMCGHVSVYKYVSIWFCISDYILLCTCLTPSGKTSLVTSGGLDAGRLCLMLVCWFSQSNVF